MNIRMTWFPPDCGNSKMYVCAGFTGEGQLITNSDGGGFYRGQVTGLEADDKVNKDLEKLGSSLSDWEEYFEKRRWDVHRLEANCFAIN